jgi:PAS domain S-box-containing protein
MKMNRQNERSIEALPAELFLKAFSSSHAFMAVTELETGRFVEANEAYCRLVGYSRGELIGRSEVELGILSDEQLGKIRSTITRDLIPFEVSLRSKSGELKYVSASADLVWVDGRGYAVSSGFEITEHKRVESRLRKSEDTLRSLFEGRGEAVFIHDFNGRFLEVNGKASKLTGYSKEDLLQKSPMDLDARKEQLAERFVTLAREGSLAFETDLVRKDGSLLPVEITLQVIQYGEQRAILGVARNISARRTI